MGLQGRIIQPPWQDMLEILAFLGVTGLCAYNRHSSLSDPFIPANPVCDKNRYGMCSHHLFVN
jgi:hypothetical protein